eukprot:608279-Prymnesium_polylepis.1
MVPTAVQLCPRHFNYGHQCRAERHFHYVNYLASAHAERHRAARGRVPFHGMCPYIYSINRPWRRSAESASLEVI